MGALGFQPVWSQPLCTRQGLQDKPWLSLGGDSQARLL